MDLRFRNLLQDAILRFVGDSAVVVPAAISIRNVIASDGLKAERAILRIVVVVICVAL